MKSLSIFSNRLIPALFCALLLTAPLSAQEDASQGVGGEGGEGELELGDGQVTGDERYVRGNREAGDLVGSSVPSAGLVGQDADGPTAGGAGGLGGGGGFSQLFNAFNQQLNNQAGGGNQLPFRVPMRLGFVQARPTVGVVGPRLQRQLTKIQRLPGGAEVAVQIDGRTAVLVGSVPTEQSRRLAAQMALLEPGIADVRNELQVVPDPAVPEVPQPVSRVRSRRHYR